MTKQQNPSKAILWFLLFLLTVQHIQNLITNGRIKDLEDVQVSMFNTQQKLIDTVCYLEGHCPEPEWESFYE